MVSEMGLEYLDPGESSELIQALVHFSLLEVFACQSVASSPSRQTITACNAECPHA